MSKAQTLDPSTRFVRSLDGEYFMVREVADMVGLHHNKLRALMKTHPDLGPSFCTFFGSIKIYLYTREDINRIFEHIRANKQVFKLTDTTEPRIGRPPKWSEEQNAERQRLFSSRHYYRKKAEVAKAAGEEETAQAAQARVDQIEERLNEMEQEVA